MRDIRAGAVCALILVVLAGCAARTPPPLPSVLAHPEFVYPAVPPTLARLPGAERVDRGWRFLQNDALVPAEGEFSRAVSRSPGLYPAMTGAAYVSLARRDSTRALERFDAALTTAPRYVPALVGRGLTLLASDRTGEALEAFESSLEVDGSLADVRRRVDVLRLRVLQDVIAEARGAASAGRLGDARQAYHRAVEASPQSAFLHRELGLLERRAGQDETALDHFRRAVEADEFDRESLVQIGEILDAREDFAGAEEAFRRAGRIDADPALDVRIARTVERARDARLPAEFRALPASAGITRGDLAALIGVRLEALVQGAPQRQLVVTDAVGHWAAPWISPVARAGIVEAFENHTFQPGLVVRRGDLAVAVRQVLELLSRERPAVRAQLAARPPIDDMDPAHLAYPAAAAAVSAGVLPLIEGRFLVNHPVTGAEAVAAVDRLRTLAGAAR